MNRPASNLNLHTDFDTLAAKLSANASEEHQTGTGIGHSVTLLREARLMNDSGYHDPGKTAKVLMRIGAANLSVARLYEGHVNALRIVELHGNSDQRRRITAMIKNDAFLGVWGADGIVPVCTGGTSLSGSKIYTSGLGTVTHAIITADGPDGQIGLIQVDDTNRQKPEQWSMSGMRATRSGEYDFAGIDINAIDWIGQPGCYGTEPGFVGGVWRIAALQLGATMGLIDAAARKLRALDRMNAEAQLSRLTAPYMRALGAEALVMRAAKTAESATTDTADRAAVLSASARLLTEEIGQQTIAAVEQCIGLSHFSEGSETGRIAQDLAVYMRQAARDALLLRVARYVLCRDNGIWEMRS